MPDDMDFAQEVGAQWLDDCLAEHQRQKSPEFPFAKGNLSKTPPFEKGGLGGICIDCATPIPAARLAAVPGCRRCLDCQTAFERRNQ